ncbi:hypothetical protein EYF80_016765 [Liparis tanakae]|uniref:Uncharacterized protein n=1 Tax=Liparis tanakae TaxID=230148 RepID=A0A4Z2I690_9TELE|nr:hypothetical protein EYF80_016765 [Liparis tanakae]
MHIEEGEAARQILKVCFLRLAVESVSSPVEPLSSSSGLFLEDSCGMRLLPFAPGCPPVGDGVSGSVELGLSERDDSDRLWISGRLGDCSVPYIFFMRMGLSWAGSGGPASWTRFPPLGRGGGGVVRAARQAVNEGGGLDEVGFGAVGREPVADLREGQGGLGVRAVQVPVGEGRNTS